jgi:hypothetical protein
VNYHVGQILYICNEKKLNIYPVQVVEEVIRTTLKGKEKTYIVMLPDKERTRFDILKIKDDLFEDISSVKKHMILNAQKAIEKMANAAVLLGDQSFELLKLAEDLNDQKDLNVQAENKDDIILVELGNGVKAKISSTNLKEAVGQK